MNNDPNYKKSNPTIRSGMTHIFFVNEFTLPALLWGVVAHNKKPLIAYVEALFPPFQGALERLVQSLLKKGMIGQAIDICPNLHHIREYEVNVLLYDIFGISEPWHNDFFHFAKADASIQKYAMPYKIAVSNYTLKRHLPILLVSEAASILGESNIRIHGMATDTAGLFDAYFGRQPPGLRRIFQSPKLLMNGSQMFLFIVAGFGWISMRFRPFGVKRKKIFLAVDNLPAHGNESFFSEFQDGGHILGVHRSRKLLGIEQSDVLPDFKTCFPDDGGFGPKEAIRAAAMIVRDSVRLFRVFRQVEPALYYQVAALPFRRTVIRALLNRFRPDYYWARDSYNPEHVLRRQELHRIGAKSHGMMSGATAYATLEPQVRYISYDRYYVFGKVFHKHFKETWAADMAVVPTGSFNGSRREIENLYLRPKGLKDIVVMTAPQGLANNPVLRNTVRQLAGHFPERTVYLQMKPVFRKRASAQRFIADCKEGLGNVVYTEESLSDLFMKCEYAFADPSTVILEAIQFGLKAFMVDASDVQHSSCFRDFPGICLSSPEAAVDRVLQMKNKTWVYPLKELEDLVDMSGRMIYDVMREGMGLPPRGSREFHGRPDLTSTGT